MSRSLRQLEIRPSARCKALDSRSEGWRHRGRCIEHQKQVAPCPRRQLAFGDKPAEASDSLVGDARRSMPSTRPVAAYRLRLGSEGIREYQLLVRGALADYPARNLARCRLARRKTSVPAR